MLNSLFILHQYMISPEQVERIKQTQSGLVDLDDLESKLQAHCQTYELILGCFSAASNVTGIITDTKPVAALLHHYGALSFWDYATAGEFIKWKQRKEAGSV